MASTTANAQDKHARQRRYGIQTPATAHLCALMPQQPYLSPRVLSYLDVLCLGNSPIFAILTHTHYPYTNFAGVGWNESGEVDMQIKHHRHDGNWNCGWRSDSNEQARKAGERADSDFFQ